MYLMGTGCLKHIHVVRCTLGMNPFRTFHRASYRLWSLTVCPLDQMGNVLQDLYAWLY